MKAQYYSVYNNFDLIQKNLQTKLEGLFTAQTLITPISYQEILVYLDEQCRKFQKSQNLNSHVSSIDGQITLNHSNNINPDDFRKIYYRADRNISSQIFENCSGLKSKVTLQLFIQKYIQLLQSAKLCLLREEAKQQVLVHRLKEAQKALREKTYVYIRLIQASVHSRYSDSPCFQYKLTPSSIPIVTVVNSLNPILNHEYTLQMDQDDFWIVFYESGVEIYKWKFSISNCSNDGEYFKSTAAEAVTFQVQVKMLPKRKSEQIKQIQRELKNVQEKLQLTKKAFGNLCYYMPFQQFSLNSDGEQDFNKGFFWKFTSSLFSLVPFLRNHVLVLHYFLIILVFVQCLAAVSWAMEFIDLIIAFGVIGVLYDREKDNISMYMWAGFFALCLSTLKTVWGAFLMPFGMPKYPFVLAIAILFKVFTLFFVWICIIRSEEIADQRKWDIYGIEDKQEKQENEYEKPIFKANQNYYRNKH